MISIIVPVFNTKATIERCVNALRSQTYADIQIILINDGSTDGSETVCDEFTKQDSRIMVIHQQNAGVSTARNTGLDHATGEYIMFCDSDDWAEPEWCDKLHKAAFTNPDSLPICNYYRNTPSSQTINRAAVECHISREDFFGLNRQELLGIPWNKIFRRQIIEEQRIRFRSGISLGEDLIFTLDYLHHIPGGLYFFNMPLYHYSLGNIDNLSAKYYPDLAGIYQIIYGHVREEMTCIPDAWKKWAQEYQRSYFFAFDRVFRNSWSDKNTSSLLQKWQYNASVFHSSDFQASRQMMLNDSMNVLQHLGLKSNCFIIYWLTVIISEWISSHRHRK